ncbi:unnamed protein product [Fusarium graminearum]|nr:unnamed protein product [Fusarium graminearum]
MKTVLRLLRLRSHFYLNDTLYRYPGTDTSLCKMVALSFVFGKAFTKGYDKVLSSALGTF